MKRSKIIKVKVASTTDYLREWPWDSRIIRQYYEFSTLEEFLDFLKPTNGEPYIVLGIKEDDTCISVTLERYNAHRERFVSRFFRWLKPARQRVVGAK